MKKLIAIGIALLLSMNANAQDGTVSTGSAGKYACTAYMYWEDVKAFATAGDTAHWNSYFETGKCRHLSAGLKVTIIRGNSTHKEPVVIMYGGERLYMDAIGLEPHYLIETLCSQEQHAKTKMCTNEVAEVLDENGDPVVVTQEHLDSLRKEICAFKLNENKEFCTNK